MHPSAHAKTHPDKPAFIMAYSGETVTYGELEARSNQGAHLFRKLGSFRHESAFATWLHNGLAAIHTGAGNMKLPAACLLGNALTHVVLCPVLYLLRH